MPDLDSPVRPYSPQPLFLGLGPLPEHRAMVRDLCDHLCPRDSDEIQALSGMSAEAFLPLFLGTEEGHLCLWDERAKAGSHYQPGLSDVWMPERRERQSFRAATLHTSRGELAGIIGADADGGCDGVGHLWMYATDALDEYALDASARWLTMEKEWAWVMMKSFVDARNAPRIAWLDRLGFEVRQDARPYGIGGHSFRTGHLRLGRK